MHAGRPKTARFAGVAVVMRRAKWRDGYALWPVPGENQPVLLLRGGLVADGIGSVTRRGDVLIDGPQIASVDARGAAPDDCEVIDLASGSVICPGFIDAHAHAEGPLLAD